MSARDPASSWASRFGLALAPLFEESETRVEGSHHVLLDGGFGSFALSVSEARLWKDTAPADWSWSSNLPHHVTVTNREVAVVRWDKPQPELLTRSSVESQIEAFYAFLSSDRVRSSQRVVDHMVTTFRRVRSLVADAEIDDELSIDAYLAFLERAIRRSHEINAAAHAVAPPPADDDEILRALSPVGVDALLHDLVGRTALGLPLTLLPELAVRHAGSEIFQEAHFELIRAPRPDLFGYAAPAESRQITRGGAHFTPPALARSLVEQALAQLPDLANRAELTVLDPACGSGAFLHEAIRTLRRTNFRGRLIIVGRDTSRPAVSMANFVLSNARRDWSPEGGCQVDIRQGDSLQEPILPADIVVMNPPFISWSALTAEQRRLMQDVLGDRLQGRGDFSMAFVTRALEALKPGGVLGTLLPGSLLTLRAAESWRSDLLDRSDLRFVASLGDFGLFAYALVQVAAAVFAKPACDAERSEMVTALVTANDSEATGNALRMLRRNEHITRDLSEDTSWRLFRTSATSLRSRPTWRLTSPRTEAALALLNEVGGALPINELFDVRQGVRTGANHVFVLSEKQVNELPRKEREWFRPAVMNESVNSGKIDARHWIFYPYTRDGLAITNEDQLRRLLPTYSGTYLQPNRATLERRANIVRANRSDWWGLSERRAWALDPQPRLISKYFGGPGGFAADLEASYIVVQGFAWFPKWISADDVDDDAAAQRLPTKDILAAYIAIMNSTPFLRLLEVFSPHVAGGQVDLSPRYVNSVPIPNLLALASDERAGKLTSSLAKLGWNPRLADADWRNAADRMTTEFYGGDILAGI